MSYSEEQYNNLKARFSNGQLPKEKDFADLIDSIKGVNDKNALLEELEKAAERQIRKLVRQELAPAISSVLADGKWHNVTGVGFSELGHPVSVYEIVAELVRNDASLPRSISQARAVRSRAYSSRSLTQINSYDGWKSGLKIKFRWYSPDKFLTRFLRRWDSFNLQVRSREAVFDDESKKIPAVIRLSVHSGISQIETEKAAIDPKQLNVGNKD